MEQLKEVEDVSKRCKRDSLRRWKARCWLLRPIPEQVIVEYNLKRWFIFVYDIQRRNAIASSAVVHNKAAWLHQIRKRRRRFHREITQWTPKHIVHHDIVHHKLLP